MNIKELAEFIVRDDLLSTADNMSALITAIKERQKINRSTNSAILHIGMKVKLNGLRPKYWNGMVAEVVGFNKTRTRANIKILDNLGSDKVFTGTTRHGFPVNALTIIDDTPKSTLTKADDGILIDFINGL